MADDRVLDGAEAASVRYLDERTYAATRAPLARARTLLPDAYRDERYHAVERERVFARSWVAVGFAEEVADVGATLPATVADQPVVVTRDRDGVLRGFHNVCRHRGSRLVAQPCTLTRFRCPYHSWTYALDGTLLGTPLFDGSGIPDDQQGLFDTGHLEDFDRADHGLLPVHAAQWEHLVLVTLDPDPMPLEEWLGDLPDRLAGYRLATTQVETEVTYEVEANWKLVAENYMEYYHLPWVHPELVKVSRIEDHHRFQGPGMYTGMCTSPITRDEDSGWSSLPSLPGLSDDDASSGRFIWIFPNVALGVLPSHVFTMIVEPLGPTRTRERTAISLPTTVERPADHDAASARLAAFWDHVNREDIGVIEEVQRGLASRAYPGGRLAYRFEEPLHRFQNMVVDRMVGVDRVPGGDPDGPLFPSPAASSSPATRTDP